MQVKGITPVALSSPIRDQHARSERPAPSPSPAGQATAAGDTAGAAEIKGRLAQALLEDSGIKGADQEKYKISLDIDGDTGRVIAEVRDRQSGDLVTEVPSRTLLRQAAMLHETLGTILDRPV